MTANEGMGTFVIKVSIVKTHAIVRMSLEEVYLQLQLVWRRPPVVAFAQRHILAARSLEKAMPQFASHFLSA